MGKLPRMNEKQLREVRTVIQKHCCNYDNGYCIALDGDLPCECVQWYAYSLLCKWFRYSVLPNDRKLEADIIGSNAEKRCAVCGAPVRRKSKRAKYCADCAASARKDYMRKYQKRRYHSLNI